ncbi:MAG TPA: helix-turn-helix transcriptional regulator [Pseudonocardia sp.]
MTERDRDPLPWLAFIGDELRRYRVRAGLSQDQLAKKIFCVRPLVSMVETGSRLPTEEFAEACDQIFGTDGQIARMRERALAETEVPTRIGPLMDAEKRARSIRSFQPVLIPGLLQTESYARALYAAGMLAGESEQEISERVARRLRRRRILDAPNPVEYWVVLDESVLHRIVGTHEVMKEQLRHLLQQARRRNVNVQIMPFSAGSHPAPGPLTVLGMPADEDDMVHLAGPVDGQTTSDPVTVRECAQLFDLLRSQALSLAESVRMIESRLKELGNE